MFTLCKTRRWGDLSHLYVCLYVCPHGEAACRSPHAVSAD